MVGQTPPSSNHVCRLKKALYGLRASWQWYAKLTYALHFKGFTHSLNDYYLFFKKRDSSICIVAIYVNDILLGINELKVFLNQEVKIKDLGNLHYFLGMEVPREQRGLILNQRNFTLNFLAKFDILGLTPVSSPLDPTSKLLAN